MKWPLLIAIVLVIAGCSTKRPEPSLPPSPPVVVQSGVSMIMPRMANQPAPQVTGQFSYNSGRHSTNPPPPLITKILFNWNPNYTNDLEFTVLLATTNFIDWFPVWMGRTNSTIVSNRFDLTHLYFKTINNLAADSNSVPISQN